MGVIGKAKTIIGNPNGFFQMARSEQGVGGAFKYLAVLGLIPLVIIAVLFSVVAAFFISLIGSMLTMVPGLDLFGSTMFLGGLGILIGVMLGVLAYVAILIGSFFGSAILHLFAYSLGARQGYSNTYKAVAYSTTPSLLFGWIPLIGLITPFWAWYLNIVGLSVMHQISKMRAFLITILPMIVIGAIAAAVML